MVQLVEHGLAHQDLKEWQPPGPGDLLYECVICPNPDENMREHWEKRPDRWGHFYAYNIDGNFEGQHTISRVPENNQPLYPGAGAFNHPDEAAEALKRGKDDRHLSQSQVTIPQYFEGGRRLTIKQKDRVAHIPCHNHRAASTTGKSRNHSTDIQGIGSIVCARHGCFCAGGSNNFTLGETCVASLDGVRGTHQEQANPRGS